MAEAHERRLLGTSAFLVAAYGAGYLMQLAALPWVVRAVGAESFGIISFANAFIQYLIILTDYGFNLSASREVSIRRHDRAALQDIYASVLALKLGLCAVAALVLLASILYFPNFRAAAPVLVCSFGLVVGQALHPSWLLQGLERQRIAAVMSVSCKALGLAAVLALVHAPADFLFVPLAGAGAQLLVAVVCGAWIWRTYGLRPAWPRRGAALAQLRHSTHYFGSRVAVSIYTSSSTFVLGLVLPYASVGRYAMADTLYRLAQGPFHMLAAVLAPHMAHKRDMRLFMRLFGAATLLNAVGCGLAWWLAPWATDLLFGAEGAGSAEVLRPLILSMIFVVPSVLLGYPCLAAMGDERWANNSVIAGAGLHLLILGHLYFAQAITPESVAWAVMFTEALVLVLRYGRLCALRFTRRIEALS